MTVRRSSLSTPASNPGMIEKAAGSDADEVILDLEDAVPPDRKADAREAVVDAARRLDWDGTALSFRMNGLRTPDAYRDLVDVIEAVGEHVETVVVPKVRRPEDVYAVEVLLSGIEANAGIDRVGLQLLIEEAEALGNVDAIAAASDRVETLVFGSGDYSASIGIDHPSTREGDPGDVWRHARSAIVNAARSAGADPIDGPYVDFSDPEGYREEAERAAAMGFVGKWVIHPNQIGIANEVFAPSAADVEHARAVLDALDGGEAEGAGSVDLDGVMVDRAHRRHARHTLELARELGMIEE